VVGSHTFETIAAGGAVSCGLDASGYAWCWGLSGQTGSGIGRVHEDHVRAIPEPVGYGGPVSEVSATFQHSCLLDQKGAAYCWGNNFDGQLGLGHFEVENPRVPDRVATDLRFSQIRPFGVSTCTLTPNGKAYCWGDNQGGQGARPEDEPMYAEPRPVTGDHRFRSLADVGVFGRTCAIGEDDRTYCWGSLGYGLDHLDEELVRTPAPLLQDPGFRRVFTGGAGGATSRPRRSVVGRRPWPRPSP
jgi:alpha-tubulin suppressor-like RCC1 family protein